MSLADALLAAAGGLREASALRRSLEQERDGLAPPRKVATRPFYVALDRWSESRRQLKDSYVRPREWAEREKALRDAEALRDASNRAATEAGERLRRLERVRRVRPLLTAHAMAAAWLEANPHAPRLPADLAERLPSARGALAQAAHTVETARADLARLDGDIAEVVTDDALLATTEEVQALMGMAGLVEQALAGLPGAEEALEAAQAKVAEQTRVLGHPATADPASLVPPPTLVTQLRRLMAEHTAQEGALAGLPRRKAEQQARLAEAERAIAELPPLEDVQQLEAVLAEIRREGDPARNLAVAERAVTEAGTRLSTALAHLPTPLRDPGALTSLDPPTAAGLERLAEVRAAAKLALERQDDAVGRAEAALAKARSERTVLEEGGAPPTREELAQARARREEGWDLVFRRLSGEAPAPDGDRDFCGGRPLALAYANAVAAADRIADARWTEAERATQAERLVRVLKEREAESAAARAALDIARATFDAAQVTWAAVVHPLGLDGGAGLAEAQRLLTARETALTAVQALAVSQAGLSELKARQDNAAARLRPMLGGADLEALLLLLDRADAVVRQRRTAQDRRREHLAAAAAARAALGDIEQERCQATESLTRWQAKWSAALERLGQAPDLPVHLLDAVLSASESLAGALREASRLNAQARIWREGLERFETGFAMICERLGVPAAPDALAGMRELARRQRTEAALAARRAALLGQREKGLATLRQHEDTLSRAEAALRAVVAAAGATTAEAAEERIALGAERARHEAMRVSAEADLLTAGDGLPLEDLRAEAAAHPADGLEAALQEAEEAQQRHAAAAQIQVAAVTTLGLELQRLAGDDAAVRAAANEAAAAGQLGQTLEDALLMQVAAGLLDAALVAVQEGGDDALLRRIGAAFSELTDGAYIGVSSREDDRGTARLVLRMNEFPDDEVEVDQLSEGTRDQLFLALRLVAVADQAASGTVLPFVGDDVLQSFDNQRAAAAFQALLRLSETTQVILLSHHEHLLAVLQNAIPSSIIHLQRVDR
ncbi:hypothetical protein [Muricoccus radiodurans]|uniref:hypothetical protein n=1 Tax=Muricoccus radiodurans TaxID=2231721 RepID=UPI003CE8D78B